MSKESERSIRAMQEFLEKNVTEDMSVDEVNAFMQEHLTQINQSIPRLETQKDAKTAEDFLILAERAEGDGDIQEALRFVRKALKLDPNDLDAELMEIRLGEKNPLNVLKRLRLASDNGRRRLEKEGYFDDEECIGEFWTILETRPYMRIRDNYVNALYAFGMLRQAAREAEDMIRLNETDNLGERFVLMHIYAALEDAQSAEALLEKYSEHDEGQMLLPLALLYYKLGDTKKAESYIKRLSKVVDETKKFIRDYLMDDLEKKHREITKEGGYRPFSEEELIFAYYENSGVYDGTPTFFLWAANILKIKY